MAAPSVRTATHDDWPAIWPIFDEVVSAGETYAYPADLDATSAQPYWLTPPPDHCVVAVDGAGTVLGTARWGPNRPGRGAHVATASFMVASAARGRGVGRGLGEHVLAAASRAGYRAMQFNAVVETNHAAVALWQSLGFTIVGTVPAAFDHARHGPVGLHVMHRYL